jgi:hypothetical protein
MSVQGLLDEAERTAYLISDERLTAAALTSVVRVLVQVDPEEAERVAYTITDEQGRSVILAR